MDRQTGSWQDAAGYSWVRSRLRFEGGRKPTLTQWGLTNTISYYSPTGWNLGLGGGAILGGKMRGDGLDLSLDSGWLISVRGGLSLLEQDGNRPFLSASLACTYSRVDAEEDLGEDVDVSALDFRLGFTVGYTLFDIWQVYLAPSVFAGPVTLELDNERTTGGDRYHFQAGLGTSLLLPGRFTLFAYGAPLGEESVSAGIAFAF
jgi:hypothetical protein